jgi:excisionase family DNA binding protein
MSTSSGIVWLNTAETARRLGVTPRTLYRFIDDGQLPAYRFGRVIRLKEAEVEQFIENCRIQPGTLDSAYHEEEVIDIEDSSLSASSRR